jgi:uncharacterized protein (DUF2062 family)
MSISLSSARHRAAEWLRQGVSPRRLALTLALGFAVGCIPVVGLPTALCALLALVLKLNLPAIQAANYVVMPLQLVLIAPFMRLGRWLFSSGPHSKIDYHALLHLSPWSLAWHLTGFAGQALAAWLLIAAPAVAVLTVTLTHILRRVPAIAASKQAGEPAR